MQQLDLQCCRLGARWIVASGLRLSFRLSMDEATWSPKPADRNAASCDCCNSAWDRSADRRNFFADLPFLPFTAMQPIIPLLVAQKFQLSAELWGAVCAAEGLAKILCAMPVAALLSSWGRKPVLVLSFICFGFSMTALAHNGTILGLLGAKLLVGAAVLAQNSGMQLFLTDISSSENKSRVMAPVLMAEKLSSMIGPLIGGKLIQVFGATAAMTQLAVITFFLGFVNQGMLKETKPRQENQENLSPNDSPKSAKKPSEGKLKQLLQDVRVKEAVIFSAFYWGIMASTLYCLVPLMLTQVFGLGALAFSVVLAATNLLCFLCAKPAAEWSDRWGRKAVLVPGMVLVGIATVLLPGVPKVATSQSSEILLLTLLLGALAVGQGLVGPALPTIFTDGLAPSLQVESLSLLRISTEVGAVTLSLAMCYLVGSSGFGLPLVAAGVAALFAAARFSIKYQA